MKYIKTFETTKQIYDVEDYVVMKNNIFVGFELTPTTINTFKILDTHKYNTIANDKGYQVESIDNKNHIITFSLYQSEIKRLATPEEIQNYNILKSTNKFNL